MMPDKLHHAALIFANGDPNDGEMVRRWLDRLVTPYVIAADGGITVARYFGYAVNCVIGDMDSADPNDLVQLEAQNALVLRHPPEKDETDLELALKILPELAGSSAMMAAGNQRIEVLRPGRHRIVGEAGDTISLIPMGGAAEGIVTHALKYPLRGETLYIGPARGISNVMLTDEAEVQFDAGLLLLIHTVGAA
jgi:thiamine pyrophosphokinase